MTVISKRVELLVGSLVFAVALWNVSTACQLTAPETPPSALSCAAIAQVLPCFDVAVGVTSDSAVILTFRGRTVSGGSLGKGAIFILGVALGTNEFTARTSSPDVSFKFFAHGVQAGGIEVGSLQSVAGPVTTIANADCRVTYAATPATPRPYEIAIRFNVVTGSGDALC